MDLHVLLWMDKHKCRTVYVCWVICREYIYLELFLFVKIDIVPKQESLDLPCAFIVLGNYTHSYDSRQSFSVEKWSSVCHVWS